MDLTNFAGFAGEANLKEEYAQTVVDNKVFRLEGGAISEFKVSVV